MGQMRVKAAFAAIHAIEGHHRYFHTLTPFGSVHLAHLHHHNFAETLGKPF